MTQAPERIWATGQNAQPSGRWWHETELKSGVEYIRADLVPQWQPIETAPRDGTWFLMKRDGREPIVVNWPEPCSRGIWHKFRGKWSGFAAGGDGTSWMLIPE